MVRDAIGKSVWLVEMKISLKRYDTAARSNFLEISRACFKSRLRRTLRIEPRISGGSSISESLEAR